MDTLPSPGSVEPTGLHTSWLQVAGLRSWGEGRVSPQLITFAVLIDIFRVHIF